MDPAVNPEDQRPIGLSAPPFFVKPNTTCCVPASKYSMALYVTPLLKRMTERNELSEAVSLKRPSHENVAAWPTPVPASIRSVLATPKEYAIYDSARAGRSGFQSTSFS